MITAIPKEQAVEKSDLEKDYKGITKCIIFTPCFKVIIFFGVKQFIVVDYGSKVVKVFKIVEGKVL